MCSLRKVTSLFIRIPHSFERRSSMDLPFLLVDGGQYTIHRANKGVVEGRSRRSIMK